MFKTICAAILLTLAACKSQETPSREISDVMEARAREQLGDQVSFALNQSSSYLLCRNYRLKKASMPPDQVRFMVFDHDTGELLLEETLEMGTVAWHSDQELVIKLIPGIVQTGETEDDFVYLLDVVSGKKRKKKQSK